jgi:hypothetical protein
LGGGLVLALLRGHDTWVVADPILHPVKDDVPELQIRETTTIKGIDTSLTGDIIIIEP